MNNIFDILSVADKELVHSAMLNFFIESNNWKGYFFDFFELSDYKKDIFYPKLEYSCEFKGAKNTKKKRIRFDLVLFEDKDQKKPILVIENKFKATPTVEQLKLYDEFISSEQNSFEDVTKILFVFSIDSVSNPVEKYCNEKCWLIIPYVKVIDNNPTLLDFLDSKIKEINYCPTAEKEKLFLLDYIEHLKEHQQKLSKLIKSDISKFPVYNEAKISRFHYLQFLLFIQKEIFKKIQKTNFESSNLSLYNDGGKNNLPSVNFWLKIDEDSQGYIYEIGIRAAYASIDGDIFRLGFYYDNEQIVREVYKNQRDKFFSHLKDSLFPLFEEKVKFREFHLNKSSNNKGESVYSVMTCNLSRFERDDIVEEISEMTISFFLIIFNYSN